jgi:hypothetical protein
VWYQSIIERGYTVKKGNIMIALITKLLPKEYRAMLGIGQQIFANLDTKEERADVLAYAKEMFADGQVTVPEWGKFGGKLGILRGRGKNGRRKK